jgi:predicted nucleotidyltransferase component of viral defense system
MAIDERYRKQVALLVQTIPAVAAEDCFALKGGTAINLFVRDMPRLSVDIDLTYLPVASRTGSLAAIEAALLRIKDRISQTIGNAHVAESRLTDGTLTRLIAQRGRTQVKIEVTPVLRGCVFAPEERSVSEQVEESFGFAEMRLVSFADLYAGKIMAALDRQHPRDLFDVRDLLAHEGISDDLRRAFIVYLISHDSPIAAVLGRGQKDIEQEFRQNFQGMTAGEVALDELLAARQALVDMIVGEMPTAHREFLVSFKAGMPDWDKLGVPSAAELPAVQWKQLNLDKLSPDARKTATARLAKLLGVKPPA